MSTARKIFLFIALPLIAIFTVTTIWTQQLSSSPELTDKPQQAPTEPLQQVVSNPHDIYPQVWTKNGYDGESYEYKVNCGDDYKTLNECFLFKLTAVETISPSGKKYSLEKDFNINEYSGEITRRWVLYGPADGGLPVSGNYVFNYFQGKQKTYSQTISYQPTLVDAPANVKGQQNGNSLEVSWTAPTGITKDMWYKVIIFPSDGNVISEVIDWNKTSAVLDDLPLKKGDEIGFNVSIFFDGGYAYPKDINITWR